MFNNWRKTEDVTQFVSYQLMLSVVDKVLMRYMLFSMLVEAVSHELNHDGFTNVYNETPLGIFFKNQSVMETHNCHIAINILAKEECKIYDSDNLLSSSVEAFP